eukprot:1905378-Lingulodinium_polyedra.AAC.1
MAARRERPCRPPALCRRRRGRLAGNGPAQAPPDLSPPPVGPQRAARRAAVVGYEHSELDRRHHPAG